MPTLDIQLLGDFRLRSDAVLVTTVNTPRMQSLLAYLVLHRGAPQSRQFLAYQFWPDSSEKQARTNLRNLFHRLRQALPNADRFLYTDSTHLQWHPKSSYQLDVAKFEQALIDQSDPKGSLEKAIALYQGPLLANCYDEWLFPIRERLHQQAQQALHELITLLENERDYTAATQYCQQLLRYDPLEETTYQLLMRLYALQGNRAAALRTYHTCTTTLQRELAVEPNRITQEAYHRLLNTEVPLETPVFTATYPLIGRQQAWQQLQHSWEQAATGKPHLVLLAGEAGQGKTRLAEEFTAWAARQGHTTATAHLYATDDGLAYAPITVWLRHDSLHAALLNLESIWLTEISRLLPELLTQWPELAQPGPLNESWQRQRFFEALSRAVLATESPLLLFLDDLQWANRETLDWLHHLLRFDPQAPLLILTTLRPESLTPEHPLTILLPTLARSHLITQLELPPLSQAETTTLATHLIDQPTDAQFTQQLYQETEGNPLFIIEMLHHRDRLSTPPSPTSLPITIQAVISDRLNQLTPSTRELMNLAAVIGRDFRFDVLAGASGITEVDLAQQLDELWQRRIIREQGEDGYDFSHHKIREVAYAEIGSARRRLLHRRVARVLQTIHAANLDLISGQIAVHLAAAGLREQAYPYLIKAAAQAVAIYAYHQAERYYRQAIDLSTSLTLSGPDLIKLYTAQGRILEHRGAYIEAIQHYHQLEKLGQDRQDQQMECTAISHLVTTYIEPNDVHNLEQAEPLIKRGLTLAREIADPEQEARLLWSQMVQATHYGQTQEAQQAGEASVALARQHNLQNLLAIVLHDLALNLRLNGMLEQGTAYAEEARALLRRLDNRPLLVDNLNQQAFFEYAHLDFEQALRYAAEATQISQSIENGWNVAYAALVQGMVHRAIGEWGQAQTDWQTCIEVGQQAGFLMAFTMAPVVLADLLEQVGQAEKAQSLLEQAHQASQEKAPFLLQAVEAQLAINAYRTGQVEAGQRWYQQSQTREPLGQIGTVFIFMPLVLVAGAAARHNGRWAEALTIIEQAIQEANDRHLMIYLPRLLVEAGVCLLAMEQQNEAETRLHTALATAQEANLLPVILQGQSTLARHYQQHNRPQEADTARQIVQQAIDQIAASLTDPAQRAHFLAATKFSEIKRS